MALRPPRYNARVWFLPDTRRMCTALVRTCAAAGLLLVAPAGPAHAAPDGVASLVIDLKTGATLSSDQPDVMARAVATRTQRVELYTEPFARAYEKGADAAVTSFEEYAVAATLAHDAGLGVNAGHDLDLANLVLFRELPHLDEVTRTQAH